ncbi:phage head-tail joining protein [Delftia tsuruhatensis]|uniref:phage head-tail joining protein n=1 Tax=Delftia tsuruhatensis TaxID=180282 RepID=UPI003A89365E
MSTTTTEDAATLRGYVKALNKAIARGARSVTLGGQTITYNTTESLMKARNDMQAQLAAAERAASSQKVSRQNYAVYGGRDF